MFELRSQTKADIAGLVALTLTIALLWFPGWRLHIPDYAFLATWLVLLAISPFAWHSERWPEELSGCIGLFAASIVIGGMSFAVDAMISDSNGFPWVGSPFGSMLTLALCPGLTLVAVGGIARAYYLRKAG